MRRRKLRWVVAGPAVALLAVGGFVLWPRPPVPGLTRDNFDRVRVGMTSPQVEALLGDQYGRLPPIPPNSVRFSAEHSDEEGKVWWTDNGGVLVWFNRNGRVQSKDWQTSADAKP
jgi:hypothetical protein